ncbi:hypothetical protein [Desulfonauticus submarinus]
MSASDEWFDYHLTPQGWVEGSRKIDFVGVKEKKVPKDRVLTLRFHEYMSSGFSPMDIWYEELWRHENETLVQNLIKRYGNIPEHYRKLDIKKGRSVKKRKC